MDTGVEAHVAFILPGVSYVDLCVRVGTWKQSSRIQSRESNIPSTGYSTV